MIVAFQGHSSSLHNADKYRELTAKYFSIPAAVETHGPIHVDGANFLSKLGRRIEQSSMEKLETFSKEFQLQSSVEMRLRLRGASRNWNRWDNEFVEEQTDTIELIKK